jgi:hypothetical protein
VTLFPRNTGDIATCLHAMILQFFLAEKLFWKKNNISIKLLWKLILVPAVHFFCFRSIHLVKTSCRKRACNSHVMSQVQILVTYLYLSTFDTTTLLNQENKDKQRSQNILKIIVPDDVRVHKTKVYMYKQNISMIIHHHTEYLVHLWLRQTKHTKYSVW